MSKKRIVILGASHKMIVDITNRMVINKAIRQNNAQYYLDYMVI